MYQRTTSGWRPLSAAVTAGDSTHPLAAKSGWAPVLFGHTAADVLDVTLPGGDLTLGLPGGHISAPVHDGADVVYPDVAAATDLRYTPAAASVKEELVLRSSAAPHSFTFHLADPRHLLGRPTETTGEGWVFSNPAASGEQVLLPAPKAWSTAPGAASPQPGTPTAHQRVTASGDGWDVTLSLDSAWAAGQQFPIVLDPSISYGYRAGLTLLSGGVDCGPLYDAFGDPGIGQDCRTYVNADVSSLAGVTVNSASLTFRELAQDGDAEFPVEAHAATAVLSAGQPGSLLSTDEAPAVVGSVAAGTANSTYTLKVTSLVRAWVNGTTPADGLILQVPGEGGNGSNFLTNTRLTITYTGTPVAGSTGTLDWTAGTPDDGTTFDSSAGFGSVGLPSVTVGAAVFDVPLGVDPSTVTLRGAWSDDDAGDCDTANASGTLTPTLVCTANADVTADLDVTASTDDGQQTLTREYHFAPNGRSTGGGVAAARPTGRHSHGATPPRPTAPFSTPPQRRVSCSSWTR